MEQNIRGLKTVRVSKSFLLERLKANREEHRKLFEQAIDGWHQEILANLKDTIKRVKADKKYNPQWYLPMPYDHTASYDQAIELLEASLDMEFELSAAEFAQYVRDNWGWKGDFIDMANSYTIGAQGSRGTKGIRGSKGDYILDYQERLKS